jgi:hypothetical protein
MIGPDQDLSEFPRWLWPYIRVEQLVKSRIFAAQEAVAEPEPSPWHVLLGHFVSIVQAVQLRALAGKLDGPAGSQLAKAAEQAIQDEIDDWCGTKPRPLPHPHRAAQLATYLATYAASSNSERLRGDLNNVVEQLSQRAAAR